MKLKRLSFVIMIIMMATFVMAGCTEQGTDFGIPNTSNTTGNALTGKITMSGSTSMEDLVNEMGSEFTKINSGVTVDVQSGGSSVGITNAKDKIADIGNSSRALKTDEKSFGLKEYIIAIDGIAVIVNPANTAANFTSDQLMKIFTGEIKNWKEVGGADATIVVVGREAGSGTRDGFEEILKIKDKSKYTVEANETGLVKAKVKEEKYAIGYISLGKLDSSVKALKVNNITPTNDTVKDKTYAIQRPFVCLTKDGNESANAKAFLEFILSDKGQQVVEKHGYVKVK